MDTDTENNSNNQLQGAFGDRGTNVNALSYGHPYAESIIEAAKELLNETKTGKTLVKVQELRNIPIHILKGNGESGYNPQSGVIYIPVSGKKDKMDAKTLILFAKALRALEQEYVGLETPDQSMDVMEYAATLHTKNLDSVLYACKVVQEMSSSKIFQNLLDEIDKFGYSDLYRAYEKKASTKELLDIYSGRSN